MLGSARRQGNSGRLGRVNVRAGSVRLFFFFITAFFEPLLPFGGGQDFSALPPTHRLLHTPYSHAPSRWHRAYSRSLLLPKLITSRWQESKRGTDRWQGMSKRRANSTHESAPSPPPGVGAFGTSIPESILLPTRTSSHPSEPRLM